MGALAPGNSRPATLDSQAVSPVTRPRGGGYQDFPRPMHLREDKQVGRLVRISTWLGGPTQMAHLPRKPAVCPRRRLERLVLRLRSAPHFSACGQWGLFREA